MDFRQSSSFTLYVPVAAPKPAEVKDERKFKVYFRREGGKLGQMDVGHTTDTGEELDHRDAILIVKDALVESGEGWNAPVLALIKGDKNGN
jgi:hypothetical protein